MAWLKDAAGQRAVIVGGGYHQGWKWPSSCAARACVALVEALPQVMAPLDPEMAAWLHAELRSNGIDVYLNSPVTAFEQPVAGETARASMVVLKDGKRLPADVVAVRFSGSGLKPGLPAQPDWKSALLAAFG